MPQQNWFESHAPTQSWFDTKKPPEPTQPGFFSRLDTAGEKYFKRSAFDTFPQIDENEPWYTAAPKALLRSADEYTGGLGSGVLNALKSAYGEIPGIIKSPAALQPALAARATAKIGGSFLGLDYPTYEQDILNKRYGAAAGDLVPPVALTALMAEGGRGVSTKGIPGEALPRTPKVKVVPDLPIDKLNAPDPNFNPPVTPALLNPPSPTRLPSAPRAVGLPGGRVADVTNPSTINIFGGEPSVAPIVPTAERAQGVVTTPRLRTINPFKETMPPIEALPTVDTSIVPTPEPVIPPVRPTINRPVSAPPVTDIVPTRKVSPEVPSPFVVPDEASNIAGAKPVKGVVIDPNTGQPVIPRKQGLWNRLFGEEKGTFDPEAMGKEIERLKQEFLKRKEERPFSESELPSVIPTQYHGTRTEPGLGKDFGGLHIGTRDAALERLENTPSERIHGIPGGEKLYPVNLKNTKIYGPVDENKLFNIINDPKELNKIKEAGHNVIEYKNMIEDPGKSSYLVLSKEAAEIGKPEDVSKQFKTGTLQYEPQEMRVPGVKEGKGNLENIAVGGANERTLDVLGASLYSRPRPITTVQELLVNSFDEHREHGIKEPVRVLFDSNTNIPGTKAAGKSLTVRDRGKGLTPEEMYTVLTNIGETGKAGVESASGGFGFAKAAPFLGGQYARVRSVVDTPNGRKLYTFEGTPAQLKKQTKGVPFTSFNPANKDAPTGLEVTVWYDDNIPGFHQAKEWAKNMTERSPSAKGGILLSEDYAGNPVDQRKWLDETPDKPYSGDVMHPDYIYQKHAEKFHESQPMPSKVDSFEIPGAKVNIHYDITPGLETNAAELHFTNKGVYQGSSPVTYGENVANVPKDIVADVVSTVEEGEPHYPFSANREQLNTDVIQAINKWVKKNIVTGITEKRVKEIQRQYDTIAPLGGETNLHYLDEGNRFLPEEIEEIADHPRMQKALQVLENVHHAILRIADTLKWAPELYGATWKVPSERLKKFGLLFQAPEPGKGTILGVHIPRPDDMNNSAILVNLMEHLNTVVNMHAGSLDSFTTALLTTLSHEYAHIPGGAHDKNFAYRDADLHSALGRSNTVAMLDELGRAFGDGRGKLSPEISDLLQLYNESRKRKASGNDALIKTGINIERPPDTGQGKTGDVESIKTGESKSKAVRPKISEKEIQRMLNEATTPISPDLPPVEGVGDYTNLTKPEWWGKPAKIVTIKTKGKGGKLAGVKNAPLDYTPEPDLPSAPPKGPVKERFEPSTESRFGKQPPKPPKPPTGDVYKYQPPEPPEKPRNIDPNKLDVVYPNREFLKGKGKTRAEREKNIQDYKEKRAQRKPTVQEIIDKKKKEGGIKEPTFSNAVAALPKRFRDNALYQSIYERIGVSNLTKLERLGEGGKALAKVLKDEKTESSRLGGQEALKTRQVRRNLSEKEQLEVVHLLDGQIELADASSQKVKDAYKTLRQSLDYLGNEAVKAGAKMKNSKGEIVDFEKYKGEYFPHRYPDELFKDPESLKQKLLDAGHSLAAAEKMIKAVVEKGERFSSPQHSRDFNLPGYLETLDALEKHQYEMGKVITRAKRFGPTDVSDANSPISKLIRNTSNSAKAEEIVNSYLNRNEASLTKDASQRVYNGIVKAEVASKLSQFAITNSGDLAAMSGALGTGNVTNAIIQVLKDPHGSVDIGTRTGAHAILRQELLHDVGQGNLLGRMYGTMSTEKFLRTVGSLAGRTRVQQLFKLAKENPKYAKTLADFVDGDVHEVLKQDELTPEQIDFGGSRGVEESSGVPDKLTLSEGMTAKNPLLRLPFLFKRFAFLNTKNMINAVMREPSFGKRALKAAAIVGIYQVAGEAIGDVKALIKGLASGDIAKDFATRGDYIDSKNWPLKIGKTVGGKTLDRLMANFLQSALFGLVGDVTESMVRRKVGKVSGTLGGPALSDLDELAGIAGSAYAGNYAPLGKGILRRIPYIGAGLEERWAKGKDSTSKTGLPGLSGLGSLPK